MTTTFQVFQKDPDAQLDYVINWSSWLNGDAIASSIWIVPSGLTLVDSSFTNENATIWLSGGVIGQRYRVTNRITTTTSPARIDDRSIIIFIRDK